MHIADPHLDSLEWPSILAALARLCHSVPGREAALGLDFAASNAEMASRLDATESWQRAITGESSLPLGGFGDQREFLEQITQGGVPEGLEFLAFASFLRDVESLSIWITSRSDKLPDELAEARGYHEQRQTIKTLHQEIARCLLPDGEVSDNASPEIGGLKRSLGATRDKARSEVARLATSLRTSLESDTPTMLGERYVLMLKSSAQSRHDGIIHGRSQSGASVYFEPAAIVAHNNQITILRSNLAAAYERVRRDLAKRLVPHAGMLKAAHDWAVQRDLRLAKARLAAEMEALRPAISDEPRINLIDARHPVMVLMKRQVVPNTMAVGGTVQTFVISGPNAGGKTVLMKTLGLCALMAHAGLLIPAGKGSAVGYHEAVHVLLGDEQNIVEGLSTFSSHLRALNLLLESSGPGVLLLIDEIANGTEPKEGEAIAVGFLLAFADRGAATVVTTHYDGIKHLVDRDSRFDGGGMGFDDDGSRPTFRLFRGMIGTSRAIAVAKMMGVGEEVLGRAREHFAGGQKEAAGLMKRLENLQAELASEKQKLAQLKEENEALRADLQRKGEKLEDSKRRFMEQTREKMKEQLHEARDEVLKFREELKRVRKESRSREEMEKSLEKAESGVAKMTERYQPLERAGTRIERDRKGPPVDARSLQPGQRVWLPEMGEPVKVVKVDVEKRRATVMLGNMTMERPVRDLRLAPDGAPEAKPPTPSMPKGAALKEPPSDCDLRGMTVDEGVELLQRDLDRALRNGWESLRVIHGHGTGRLKEGVMAFLRRQPYVKGLSDAELRDGGSGVTVVRLI